MVLTLMLIGNSLFVASGFMFGLAYKNREIKKIYEEQAAFTKSLIELLENKVTEQ